MSKSCLLLGGWLLFEDESDDALFEEVLHIWSEMVVEFYESLGVVGPNEKEEAVKNFGYELSIGCFVDMQIGDWKVKSNGLSKHVVVLDPELVGGFV